MACVMPGRVTSQCLGGTIEVVVMDCLVAGRVALALLEVGGGFLAERLVEVGVNS